jgi:hypothetical protein
LFWSFQDFLVATLNLVTVVSLAFLLEASFPR